MAEKARPQIPSRTLRRALEVRINPTDLRAILHIPHYWAVYVHDGHGPIEPVARQWLAFFPDKTKDPRTDFAQNYPVRVTDIVSLHDAMTDEEFKEAKRERDLVFSKRSPAREGTPFFEDGLAGSASIVTPLVRDEMRALMEASAPRKEKGVAKLRIRL